MDISKTRWDTRDHHGYDSRRYPFLARPTHDVGVRVSGGAAQDLARVFETSQRRSHGVRVGNHVRPPFILGARHVERTLDCPTGARIQVLQTRPRITSDATPERSIYESVVNAVNHATRLIYIEDQYFTPFENIDHLDTWNPSELFSALLAALRRGVDVVVALPAPRRLSPAGRLQAAVRHSALAALEQAQLSARAGIFLPLMVNRDSRNVYIHSKLLIVDDRFAMVGSANLNNRSRQADSETALAIADGPVVHALRVNLWAEHLRAHPKDLDDLDVAAALLVRRVTARGGNCARYMFRHPPTKFGPLARWFWRRVDPQ